MSHETLTFVVLWIVNALIALIYLLIGALVYVPACDLKQEQGEEAQYDNRRAFLLRFIVMVLCPVVGPAFSVQLSSFQNRIPSGSRSGGCCVW